jgi:phosphatidylglycerophosphate synthase
MRGVFALHVYGTRSVIRAYQAKFKEEAAGEWACVLLYRPLSFLLTPLFAVLHVPPILVTLVGCALALALPLVAGFGADNAYLWVGLGAIAFQVLDCIDGDLARTTGKVSTIGAYADFITDVIYRVAFYTSIGMLVVAQGSMARTIFNATAVGMLAAVLAIVARLCRLRAEPAVDAGADRGTAAEDNRTPASMLYAFLSGLDHIAPIATLVLGAIQRLDWLLIWLVVYSAGDFLITQFSVIRRLK